MGDLQKFEAFIHFALKQNQGVHAKAHYELSCSGHNTIYILLAKYAGKKLVETLFCYTLSTLFMPSAQFFTTGNMNNMDEATQPPLRDPGFSMLKDQYIHPTSLAHFLRQCQQPGAAPYIPY